MMRSEWILIFTPEKHNLSSDTSASVGS